VRVLVIKKKIEEGTDPGKAALADDVTFGKGG
jgi:hypothetical protein